MTTRTKIAKTILAAAVIAAVVIPGAAAGSSTGTRIPIPPWLANFQEPGSTGWVPQRSTADQARTIDPLAVGYLIGHGLSPSEVSSWTTGACSHKVKARSCYAMLQRTAAPPKVDLVGLFLSRQDQRRQPERGGSNTAAATDAQPFSLGTAIADYQRESQAFSLSTAIAGYQRENPSIMSMTPARLAAKALGTGYALPRASAPVPDHVRAAYTTAWQAYRGLPGGPPTSTRSDYPQLKTGEGFSFKAPSYWSTTQTPPVRINRSLEVPPRYLGSGVQTPTPMNRSLEVPAQWRHVLAQLHV